MTPPPQPPPPPPPPSIDSNPKHPAGRNDMLPPLPDLPDLTPDQQSQMKKATLEHIKSMTPLKNQLHEKTVRLRSIMTTEPWDARNADQVAEEIGKAETQMLKETIRFDRAIRSLLSPDQQVLFDARPKPFLNRGKSHTISGPGNLQGSRP
jgi:Spy/CpxP family protein refolding chaperone